MNLKEVKDLIREVLRSDISEFELEHTNARITRVRLKRGISRDAAIVSAAPAQPPAVSFAPAQPIITETVLPPAGGEEISEDSTLHIITSPIVGTVYRAPSPG